MQRFYETPEGLSSGFNKRKAKIPIPAAPKTIFPLRLNTLLGYFEIFTTAHRAVVPHFRFKKDLLLYLNSSRAVPKVGISVSLQQAPGNSNLKSPYLFRPGLNYFLVQHGIEKSHYFTAKITR